jgi:hypothetical protein
MFSIPEPFGSNSTCCIETDIPDEVGSKEIPEGWYGFNFRNKISILYVPSLFLKVCKENNTLFSNFRCFLMVENQHLMN